MNKEAIKICNICGCNGYGFESVTTRNGRKKETRYYCIKCLKNFGMFGGDKNAKKEIL